MTMATPVTRRREVGTSLSRSTSYLPSLSVATVCTDPPAGAVRPRPVSNDQLTCTMAPAMGLPLTASTALPSKGPSRSPGITVSARAGKGACTTTGAHPTAPANNINWRDGGLMWIVGLDILMIWEEAAPLFSPGPGERKGAVNSNLHL